MLHLIWSILNITIILYFLYLIIGFVRKGKKIFNPQIKIFSIVIMIIGIVQIISGSRLNKSTNRISITQDYNKKNNSTTKLIKLEENLSLDLNLLVKFSLEQNKYLPIEGNSFITGFVSGYIWEFKSIDADILNSESELEYVVNGNLKWSLFGITVFSESKTFNGIMELN